MRLAKALAEAGIASRRACERLIVDGEVAVNGQVVHVPYQGVDWERDRVAVGGKLIRPGVKKRYYAINKPVGYLCSQARLGQQRILADLFPDDGERLFSVGRLDRATSGLILATNDGVFAHQVMHPSFGVVKEYLVKVAQEVSHEHLVAMSQGTPLNGVWVKPLSVNKIRRGTFKISLCEGRKHEVREIVYSADLHLLTLTRIRIGSLVLGSMAEGSFRSLSQDEIDSFAPKPRKPQ